MDQRADSGLLSESRLRAQVAATTLLLNDLGILGYSGHVSARLPDGKFLIQPFEHSRAAMTPEALLICDEQGNRVGGPDERPPSEIYIHTEIFRTRPDVNAIAHFHYDRATAFTLVEDNPLIPVKNHAIRWAGGIPVHDDPAHVNTVARGEALAHTLADKHAAQIRAHGQVIVAESVPGLFIDSVHFVENAEAQLTACQLGRLRPLSPAEIKSFSADLKRHRHVPKLWTYYTGRAHSAGLFPPSWDVAP
jgi:ribulose-5-phosphate 4-epimerase/fuculose-1-phosphate aldolase